MEGKRFLHSIKLTNLLSYGSEGVFLELEPLNVLIGPNASGKSNLIEAIGLLAATPRDFMEPFRGSRVRDWLWKGKSDTPVLEAQIQVAFEPDRESAKTAVYTLGFAENNLRAQIVSEELVAREPNEVLFRVFDDLVDALSAAGRVLYKGMTSEKSVFSQIRDKNNFRILTLAGEQLSRIRFFHNWPMGKDNPARRSQDVDLPNDYLLESGSNLGLVLNALQNRLPIRRLLLEKLKLAYEEVADVTTQTEANAIQVFFHEEGMADPIPASRLSDGVLHYLFLLTILLHPDPPPLVCIEEPELGLHPDILPKVADMLIDAAQRTQLIVTTHSDTLVSRLSEVPESVVVCERDDRGSSLRRLNPEQLEPWLEKYRLGELWAMGEIGGNRW